MLSLREEGQGEILNSRKVVVGGELAQILGLHEFHILFVNLIQLVTSAVFFGKLSDLSKLLSKGMLLLGNSLRARWRGRCDWGRDWWCFGLGSNGCGGMRC